MKLLLPLLVILTVVVVITDAMTKLDIDKEIQLLEERHEKKHRPTLTRRNPANRNKSKPSKKPVDPVNGPVSGVNNVNGENNQGNDAGNKKRQKLFLNFTEANRQITALIRTRYKKAKDMLKPTKKPNKPSRKAKACHSIATLRCGCQTLQSFEDALRMSTNVPFETRCDIRGKFFQCLDETSKPPCRHPKQLPQSYYRKHMEEIVRVLWSTRGCLLGPDDIARNSTVVKIDSGFCADLTPVKHGKDRRGDPSKPKKKKTKNKKKST